MTNRPSGVALAILLSLLLAGCPSSTTNEEDVCEPSCEGKECGGDGCGGACGWCPGDAGIACSPAGRCESIYHWRWREVVEDTGGPFDLAIDPDAGREEQCQALWDQYVALIDSASSCDGILDCSHALKNRMVCTCATYVSDPSVEDKTAQVVAAYEQLDCMGEISCGACPWIEMPDCVEGGCAAVTPMCEELEDLYAQAHEEARVCESDEECSAEQPISLVCQCPYPVNSDAWSGFFEMSLEYWEYRECPLPAPCDCVEGDALCHEGQCMLAEE